MLSLRIAAAAWLQYCIQVFAAAFANAVSKPICPTARELLDCEGDAKWMEFRKRLEENAIQGFPIDEELSFMAQELLQKHGDALVPDPHSAYGLSSGMQSFFASCNAPPNIAVGMSEPFCLYGAIAALWVLARAGYPDRQTLLSHAHFLLGKTMRNTIDFMESSSWPVSSLDILVNLQRPSEDFRLPHELEEYHLPSTFPPSWPTSKQVPKPFEDDHIRILVWEVGVHASLSAEPLQMWARFVPNAQFTHRNLIQDQYPQWLPEKCNTLYNHPRLDCDTVEDDITDMFRRRLPYSASSKEPIESIDEFAEEFRTLTRERLATVDVFLCTVAYLCLLAEGLDMPVLGYFGHPLLFMVPPTAEVREDFWPRFVRMTSLKTVGFAVSDPFLQMQFEYQVGVPRLPVIRTHALYTGATHFPARPNEVLVLDRPHECVMMCVIQKILSSKWPGDDMEAEWPTSEGRLRMASSGGYPYKFLIRALTDRTFATFSQFRAVVLWVYDMDLLTFYEFYGMNMPMFMPAHLPKYIFQQDHMDYDGQWEGRMGMKGRPFMWPREAAGTSPFDEGNIDVVNHTVKFTDYFRFPVVQYFESIPDLLEKLLNTDFFRIVQTMARFNQDSLIESSIAWRALLRRTTGWDAEALQL